MYIYKCETCVRSPNTFFEEIVVEDVIVVQMAKVSKAQQGSAQGILGELHGPTSGRQSVTGDRLLSPVKHHAVGLWS
jgi:hypothetical protein